MLFVIEFVVAEKYLLYWLGALKGVHFSDFLSLSHTGWASTNYRVHLLEI